MRAKKCDRCGKLYEHYDGSKAFKETERANAVFLIDRDLDNKHWSRNSFDLCPDCMKKLEEFIHCGTVPTVSDFEVDFPPETQFGTVKMGNDNFRAYIGDYSEHTLNTPEGTIKKRKFSIIEA